MQPNAFIMGQGLRVAETAVVPVKRLEDVLPALLSGMDNPCIYLKVDTQGYDRQVLDGAAAVLPRIMGLQSELSVRPVYQDAPDYLTSLHHLDSLGYQLTGLFPIARDNALRVIEFDCVMVQAAAVGPSTGIFPA